MPDQYFGCNPYIFAGVLGDTPAVITETIFGLWQLAGGQLINGEVDCSGLENKYNIFPDKIFLITTTRGAQHEETIKSELKKLFSIYNNGTECQKSTDTLIQQGIKFIIPEINEVPIDDIDSPEADAAYEDAFCNLLKNIKSNKTTQDTQLILGVAGGRKTMTASALFALSLFGKSKDKAYTVNMPAEYETGKGFFFPLPYEHGEPVMLSVTNYNGEEIRKVNASHAKVRLNPRRVLKHGADVAKITEQSQVDYQRLYDMVCLGNDPGDLRLSLLAEADDNKLIASISMKSSDDFKPIQVECTPTSFFLLRSIARSQMISRMTNHSAEYPIKPSRPSSSSNTQQKLLNIKCLLIELILFSELSVSEKEHWITMIRSADKKSLFNSDLSHRELFDELGLTLQSFSDFDLPESLIFPINAKKHYTKQHSAIVDLEEELASIESNTSNRVEINRIKKKISAINAEINKDNREKIVLGERTITSSSAWSNLFLKIKSEIPDNLVRTLEEIKTFSQRYQVVIYDKCDNTITEFNTNSPYFNMLSN